MTRRLPPSLSLFAAALLTATALAACGGDSEDDAEGVADPGSENEPAGDDGAGGDDEGGGELRVAALFAGSTTDADYNSLGLQALEAAEAEFGADTAYSENVAVPDAERVMREYVADGYNVVWSHGSQFFEATATVAADATDVTFIGEFDAEPEQEQPNVWVIDRNFHLGFYPIGTLAGLSTTSGQIGYIGGLSLPFSYSEVHAMQQALDDLGSDAEITPVWTGDFNDPATAQQTTSQLMNAGNDVIVGSLNLAMVGAFEATSATEPGEVLITAKYTDKEQFDPEHYAGSVLYDFEGPLLDILSEIDSGTTTGYYPLGFDTGVTVEPSDNVDPEIADQVTQVAEDIASGEITVEKNVEPIE